MILRPEDRVPAAATDSGVGNRARATETVAIAGAEGSVTGVIPEAANLARPALQGLREILPHL